MGATQAALVIIMHYGTQGWRSVPNGTRGLQCSRQVTIRAEFQHVESESPMNRPFPLSHFALAAIAAIAVVLAALLALAPQVARADSSPGTSPLQGQSLTTPATSTALTTASSDKAYTYEVTPLLAPFNGYVYVKTNNPDPYSFRLVDKSSAYFTDGDEPSAGRGVYHLVESTFLDAKYENAKTFRVKGGYLFCNRAWDSDGGKLVVQKAVSDDPARITYGDGFTSYPGDMNAGWEDTSTKVSCRALKTYTDYLIDTFTKSSMTFFEKMDAVESGLAGLAVYPRSVLDSSKPVEGRAHPFFATSPYEELSFNDHINIYEGSADGLLLTHVYPFILDSASYPGTMSSVARKLDPTCTVTSYEGAHWLINVSLNGETKVYGSGTPMGNEPIFSKRAKTDYTFDGSDDDFGTNGTLDKLRNRYKEYGEQASADAAELYALISDEAVVKAIGAGGWVRVATEGWFGYGTTYGYIAHGSSDTSYLIASDAWVDGHYINTHEQLQLNQTFADHPNADIIVRNQTYTDYSGTTHTSDLYYRYDSSTDTWSAARYYKNWWSSDEEPPAQFVLTRAQAKKIVAHPDAKKLPHKGYIFDGTAKPGTPFANVAATGVSLPKTFKVVKGHSDTLEPTVSPAKATEKRCSWRSSNEKIATVSSDGTITGVKAGKAVITATTLDGGYEAMCTVSVVNSISLAKAAVTGVKKKPYAGEAGVVQKPVVKLDGRTLVEGTHYTIAYENNVNVGKATMVIRGANGYSGKLTRTFSIVKAKNTATAKKTAVKKKLAASTLAGTAKKVALPKVTTSFGVAKWIVVKADAKHALSLSRNKIAVRAGAKAGTYTMKLKAKVAKTKNYKAASTKIVTVKITVA